MDFKELLLLLTVIITSARAVNFFRNPILPINFFRNPIRPRLTCPKTQRNVCEVQEELRKRLVSTKEEVDRREVYLVKLNDLEKKLEEYDDSVITHSSHDSREKREDNHSIQNSMENIMSSLRSSVSNIEKETKQTLSILTNEKFDSNTKNTEGPLENLKSQGVVELEEIGKLEDLMIDIDWRLGNLTNSNDDKTVYSVRYLKELYENTTNRFNSKEERLKTLQRDVKTKRNTTNQYFSLGRKVDSSESGLRSLKKKAGEIYEIMNYKEKIKEDLENFIADWTKNCTQSENPCLSEEEMKLLNNMDAESSKKILKKVIPQVLSSLFWGCSPITPGMFPNVRMRRHWKNRRLTFSCGKNKILIGSDFTECHNKEWSAFVPPSCGSRSTYPGIPSCPEIKLNGNSSLILDIKEKDQVIKFSCLDGQVPLPPLTIRCMRGNWVPKIYTMPKCIQF